MIELLILFVVIAILDIILSFIFKGKNEYIGWNGHFSTKYNEDTLKWMQSQGYNAMGLSLGNFYDETKPVEESIAKMVDFMNLGESKYGIKVWIGEGGWGLDEQDPTWQKVSEALKGRSNVITYRDEPGYWYKQDYASGWSNGRMAALLKRQHDTAVKNGQTFVYSVTEASDDTEFTTIMKNDYPEVKYTYSSYYFALFKWVKSTLFTWQMLQYTSSNFAISGTLTILAIILYSLLFGFSWWFLLLLPTLGFMPCYWIQTIFVNKNDIKTTIGYRGNQAEKTADGWEQWLLVIAGFGTKFWINVTNNINNSRFIRSFKR